MKNKVVTGSCNQCGLCCRMIGMPVFEGWLRVTPDGIQTRMPVDPTENYLEFLKAKGVKVENGMATVTPTPGAKNPYTLTSYGPRNHKTVIVRSVCPQLNEDNTCKLHGANKPKACVEYPQAIDDLSWVKPDCSYEIVDVSLAK